MSDRNHTLDEAVSCMKSNNVVGSVFVQCYNDCPEETEWVLEQAKHSDTVLGVVAGLDLVKHQKMKEAIEKFRMMSGPKFVGVRYLFPWVGEDYLYREDVQTGLQILSDNGLTFDWHSMTSGEDIIEIFNNTIKFFSRFTINNPTHSNDCYKVSKSEDCHQSHCKAIPD